MTVRELVAKFGLKMDASSFKQADKKVADLKKAAVALGSLWAGSRIVTAARKLADETAAAGDSLNVLASRSGVAIGAIQELRYAGEAAGVSVSDVDGSLQRFSRRMGAAANGNKTMAAAFKDAGVSIRDVATGALRNADDVMMDLSDKLAAMPSDSQRASVAMSLMGNSGIQMAAALKGGSAEVRKLRDEARELGLMEAELAAESSRYVANQQKVRASIQSVKNAIAGALIPWMNKATEAWLAWMKANREWLKTKIEGAVKAVSAALDVLANVAKAVADSVKWMHRTFGDLVGTLMTVALVVGVLVAALGLKALIITALVLLVEDLIGALQGKDALITRLAASIRAAFISMMAQDIDYRNSPVLAFLRDVASLSMKAALAMGVWMDLAAGKGWDEAIRPWVQMQREIDQSQHDQEMGHITAERERVLAEQAMFGPMSMAPSTVQPRTSGGGTNVEINQSIDVSFTPAEGATGPDVERHVRSGVESGTRSALMGVPMPAGAY